MQEEQNLNAWTYIQHIITQEVFHAESNLKGTSGQDKKSIVYRNIEKILDRIYDDADKSLELPDIVDSIAKDALIPYVSKLIDDAVKRFNVLGWGSWDA